MHSFSKLALGLALTDLSAARVTQRDANSRESTGVVDWVKQLLKKHVGARAAAATCFEDEYYNFVAAENFGESICRQLMDYPDVNVTTTYTPPPR